MRCLIICKWSWEALIIMLQYPFAYAESFVYLFQGSPYNSWHKEASAGESLRSKILYLSLFVKSLPVREVLPNVILKAPVRATLSCLVLPARG